MNVTELLEKIQEDPEFQQMPDAAKQEVVKQVHELEFMRVTSHDKVVKFLKATLGSVDLSAEDLQENPKLVIWFVQMFSVILNDLFEQLTETGVPPEKAGDLQQLIHQTYITMETIYELAGMGEKSIPAVAVTRIDHSDCDHD